MNEATVHVKIDAFALKIHVLVLHIRCSVEESCLVLRVINHGVVGRKGHRSVYSVLFLAV